MKRYWLHRISAEYGVSCPLLKKGYLTLGWSQFAGTGILDAARKDTAAFEQLCEKKECGQNRGRWGMWYFAQFGKGDIVVVPTAGGLFSICQVLEPAKPIGEFQEEIGTFSDLSEKKIEWKDARLTRDGDEIDLGFAMKVKILREDLRRSQYADGALTARMKMRQTNGEIADPDLCISVDKAIDKIPPANFYDEAKKGAEALLDLIDRLRPDQFEKLVLAYMKRIGADNAYIPAKNEHGKAGIADADVIAVYDALKIAVIIQVKHHEGETDDYAVRQIAEYADLLREPKRKVDFDYDGSYQVIPWVITSAKAFGETAENTAEGKGIRLITGTEFAGMLMDAGIANLDIE